MRDVAKRDLTDVALEASAATYEYKSVAGRYWISIWQMGPPYLF